MRKIDLTNVQEATDRVDLPAGAYVCKIVRVDDVPDKEYLRVFYDIAEGEFADYYVQTRMRHPDWNIGSYVKSYKPTALPMFKRFCSAVSKSNGNYVFDGGAVNSDERTLVGKRLGLVLGEEEYWSNSGELKTRLYVSKECPADKIDAQRVPTLKQLPDSEKLDGFTALPTTNAGKSEVPFL